MSRTRRPSAGGGRQREEGQRGGACEGDEDDHCLASCAEDGLKTVKKCALVWSGFR